LSEAIQVAHNNIVREYEKNEHTGGMGSTVVAVLLDGVEYEVAWVGDSRAYLWDGQLTQITRDHSYVRDLVNLGAITPEEADTHPDRHLITRCLGFDDNEGPLEVEVRQGRLSRGQEILLCSDGLTDELTDTDIEGVMAVNAPVQERVDNLVQLALDHGGQDNITAIILSAPDNAPAASARLDRAGLMQKAGLISAGALLAVLLLGLIYNFW
jgi:protein phosphatase